MISSNTFLSVFFIIKKSLIVITLKINDIIVFIVASDKPKTVKVTSLQLTVVCFNCFRRSALDKFVSLVSKLQIKDSVKNLALSQNGKKILLYPI